MVWLDVGLDEVLPVKVKATPASMALNRAEIHARSTGGSSDSNPSSMMPVMTAVAKLADPDEIEVVVNAETLHPVTVDVEVVQVCVTCVKVPAVVVVGKHFT